MIAAPLRAIITFFMELLYNGYMRLSTSPYKGARDFYPRDMTVQNYIFNTWKEVVRRYGYQQYSFPFLEPTELYEAKSGQDLGGKELYSFEDKGGKRVSIRPEKTPSVARMVAGRYNELVWPVRWFSIEQVWRYERPQRGRRREFYQLDVDIFGTRPEEAIGADVELISIAVDIMRQFGASPDQFQVLINDRRVAGFFLLNQADIPQDLLSGVLRIIDKKSKVSDSDFAHMLEEQGLSKDQISQVIMYTDMGLDDLESYRDQSEEVRGLLNLFARLGDFKDIKPYCAFSPLVVRGIDYYTGTVFEGYDIGSSSNSRSLFGGGRYDDLVGIFGMPKVSAVGFAMGDVTLRDFLETYPETKNRLPQAEEGADVFVTLMSPEYREDVDQLASELREVGLSVITALVSDKITRQFKLADRQGVKWVVVLGEDEKASGTVAAKNMETGEQQKVPRKELPAFIIRRI